MKERLTGAIILVALIVLLVPELLTGPVRPGSAPRSAASSSEEPPLRSYTIDLAEDSRSGAPSAATVEMPQPAGAAQPLASQSRASSPASITEDGDTPAGGSPTSADTAAPASEPKPALPTSASGASPAPPVARKAAAPSPVQRDLPHPGEPAPATPVQAAARKHSSHPAAKAAGAERTISAAEAGTHAGSSGEWMVQLGVFASRSNAERLAQHLKEKGFPISVSESSGKGRKLFRVRAGPVPDRSAASELAAKLRAAGASGALVPRT